MLYNDYLTREDEKAVLAQVPGVMYSSPVLEMHDRISFGGGVVKDTLVLGVSPQYQQMSQPACPRRPLLRRQGRKRPHQVRRRHRAVRPRALWQRRRRRRPDFQIQGIPFTIIGVFKESVDTFGESEIDDETILIPYSVARYFTGTENVKQIYFSMRTMDEVPDAAKEIHAHHQSRHKPNSVYKA